MRTLLIVFSMFALLAAGQAFAQDEQSIVSDPEVSLQDLQAGDPQILPSSPFYFFKELTRAVQRVFTFDSVKKAELELKITSEKAAEVKKTQDTQGGEAVRKAVESYQKAQESLKIRFEALKETSQNPNIDKLLDKLAERVVKHEKLFDEIATKSDKEEVKFAIRKAKERAEETIGEAIKKDDTAKFISRLESAFVEGKGGELKHIRSLEIIERIAEKAPEHAKQPLERLKEDFSSRMQEKIKNVLEKGTIESLQNALEALPGEKARRSILLEELQSKAGREEAVALKQISKKLEESTKGDQEHILQKAKDQIEDAIQAVQKLEEKIGENTLATASPKSLLEQARAHLVKANEAFANQKYGEAFGQARSAEVAARKGLRKLEDEKAPDASSLQSHIDELAAKISRYELILEGRTKVAIEYREEIQKLIASAKEHLGYAREALAKQDFVTAKTHIGHVKDFLQNIARLFEGEATRTEEVIIGPRPIPLPPEEPSIPPTSPQPRQSTPSYNPSQTPSYNPSESPPSLGEPSEDIPSSSGAGTSEIPPAGTSEIKTP